MLGPSENRRPILHHSIFHPANLGRPSMCDTADDGVGISNSVPRELQLRNRGLRSADISVLMPFARQLANSRENRDSHIGFVGYDKTKVRQQNSHRHRPRVRSWMCRTRWRPRCARRALMSISWSPIWASRTGFSITPTKSTSSCGASLGTTSRGVGKGCPTSKILRCAGATIC